MKHQLALVRGATSPALCLFLISPVLASGDDAGSIDAGFGTNGQARLDNAGAVDHLGGFVQLIDGRLVCVGQTESGPNLGDLRVFRLLPDGSPDTSFGGSGVVTVDAGGYDVPFDVEWQVDGRILVAGTTSPDTVHETFLMLRLNADGSVDDQFGTNGLVTYDFGQPATAAGRATLLLPDGRIVFGGSLDGGVPALARFLPDGSLDPSFGSGGAVTTPAAGQNDLVLGLELDHAGRLVVVGLRQAQGGGDEHVLLMRYLADGALDMSFGTGGYVISDLSGGSERGYDVTVDRHGRLVVVGFTATPGPFSKAMIQRHLDDGSLDTSFGDAGRLVTQDCGSFGSDMREVVEQVDGKLVATGLCFSSGGQVRMGVVRYTEDGAHDPTFGVDGVSLDAPVRAIGENVVVARDGGIVAAGTRVPPSGELEMIAIRFHGQDGGARRYCIATPNSSGFPARITFEGSCSLAAEDATLVASNLPANTGGLFFFGPATAKLAFGDGFLCVAGSTRRVQPPVLTNPDGVATRTLDFTSPYATDLVAGTTTHFQLVYRDPSSGGTGFNATDGCALVWVP